MNDDQFDVLVRSAGEGMPPATDDRIRGRIREAMRADTAAAPGLDVTKRVELGEAPIAGHRSRAAITGLMAAAALVAALVIAVRHRDDAPATVVPQTEPVEAPTTTAVTTAVAPTVASTTEPPIGTAETAPSSTDDPALPPLLGLPAGMTIDAASFPFTDPNEGWVVGADAVEQGVAQLLHTSDRGATWTRVDVPEGMGTAGPFGVAFADATHGWITGPVAADAEAVFVTDDGGASWTLVSLPGQGADAGGVYPQATYVDPYQRRAHVVALDGGGEVPVLRFYDPDTLLESAIDVPPGAGPLYDGRAAFALAPGASGASGWYVHNDRVFTGAARLVDGSWAPWTTVPCSKADETGETADVAASADGALVVVACSPAPFAGVQGPARIAVSGDGGVTFGDAAPLPTLDGGAATSAPISFVSVPAADTIVVGRVGTVGGQSAIDRSTDGGASWTTVATPTFEIERVFSPGGGDGVLVAGRGLDGLPAALTSSDDGATWVPVPGVAIAAVPPSTDVSTNGNVAIDLESQRIAGFHTRANDIEARDAPDAGSAIPSPEGLEAAIEPILGQVDLDSGWFLVPSFLDGTRPCGVPAHARYLAWGDLAFLFGRFDDERSDGELVAWQAGGSLAATMGFAEPDAQYIPGTTSTTSPPDHELTRVMADGFAVIGSSKAALETAHPGFFATAPGYVVTADDGDTITEIGVRPTC